MEQETSRWRVEERVAFEFVGDGAVVLNLRTGVYYTLNEVAARAWDLLSRASDLAAIAEELHETYEVNRATLRADLSVLLTRFEREGLATRVP